MAQGAVITQEQASPFVGGAPDQLSTPALPTARASSDYGRATFTGWRRENGRVGVRNHVVILPLDDLSNAACEAVANTVKGTLALPHAYGRLQFGEDLELHFRTLIGIGSVVLILGLAGWTGIYRLIRAEFIKHSVRDYVRSAEAVGAGNLSRMFRHILPNCMPPLIVVATVQIANSIALEATLSFLGLGLPPTEPSLGMLIANGFQYMLSGRYWISIYPGIALINIGL